MNKIKWPYFVIALLLICSACEEPTISSLSVKTSLDGPSTTLVAGDTFELEIEAKDNDGISSVEVTSAVLGIQELYDQIGRKDWKKTQLITIDAGVSPGSVEIQVTMTDDTGEVKFSSAFLDIQ